jgi:cytolysin (calcineurin-like family phosphatase)
VSSRQEEKERRRRERLEREQAEAKRAARRKRMTLAFGGLLGVALIAGIVVVVLVVGGDSDSSGGPKKASDTTSNVKLPEQATSDMQAAAKAAGCTLANPPYEGANHQDKQFKPSDYKTNPPTSGNHTPDWYDDGIYSPGDTPDLGKTVHPLEHGRIEVQYKPGTPKATVEQLEALLAEEQDGYHMLLFQNETGMKAQVAATAWTHSLTCPEMNDKVFDAIRTFRARYIDKGPERVP